MPVTIPFTFGNATTTQSLSSLDSNFSALATAVNGSPFSAGNVTPVSSVQMGIQYQAVDGSYPPKNEGSIWTGNVSSYIAISKEFNNTPTSNDSPQIALFIEANNNNTTSGPVVSVIADSICRTSNTGVFASNFIARSDVVSNAKLVGCEIDIEPSSGSTVSGSSGGLYINAFNIDGCGPAIQTGGVSNGKFSNGILINSISVAGSAVAAQSGLTCATFIDTTQATLSGPALKIKQSQTISWTGTGGTSSVTQNSGGQIIFSPANYFSIQGPNTTEGNTLLNIMDSSGIQPLVVYVARGNPANSADAAIKVNGQSVTGRSINAGGTINSSGADYAEYERRNDNCGHVKKGQIIGFDKNGLITDEWEKSVFFAVKSTNPSIVGGDNWSEIAGKEPVAPLYSPPDIEKPEYPAQSIRENNEEQLKEFNKLLEEYELKIKIHREDWENSVYKEFLEKSEDYKKRVDAERENVDRIAYCGKVPVNVVGASPGDYIVPINENGSIGAKCTNNPSFEEYKICVGKVKRILDDGRAEIVVKTI